MQRIFNFFSIMESKTCTMFTNVTYCLLVKKDITNNHKSKWNYLELEGIVCVFVMGSDLST